MTREDMIKELSQITVAATPTVMTMDMGLEFDYITSEGAGSILGMVGEWPVYKFTGIEAGQWTSIRKKLENRTLTEQDFDGTDIACIIKSLHSIYEDLYDQYYKDVVTTFADLLKLPETMSGSFFCLLDTRAWGELPVFFADEQSLKEAFRDRYCGDVTEWKDMDEEELQYWYDRLSNDLCGLAMNDYTEPEDEDTEEPDSERLRRQHREEMLEKLHHVEFQYIWPGDWKDVGFTEREIWVNSKGYGYLMCDEPNGTWWTGDGLSTKEWLTIKEKLETETLEFRDIQGTNLENALNDLYGDYYDPEEDYSEPNKVLRNLLNLPNGAVGTLYAFMEEDGPVFFDSEETFRKAYERDWCDYTWDELEDDILELWMDRLFGDEE